MIDSQGRSWVELNRNQDKEQSVCRVAALLLCSKGEALLHLSVVVEILWWPLCAPLRIFGGIRWLPGS